MKGYSFKLFMSSPKSGSWALCCLNLIILKEIAKFKIKIC